MIKQKDENKTDASVPRCSSTKVRMSSTDLILSNNQHIPTLHDLKVSYPKYVNDSVNMLNVKMEQNYYTY